MFPFAWIIHVCCKHSASVCVKRVLLIRKSHNHTQTHTQCTHTPPQLTSHYLKSSIYFRTFLSQLSALTQRELAWKRFWPALWKWKWGSPLLILHFSRKIINGFIITEVSETQSNTVCMSTICCAWVWTEKKRLLAEYIKSYTSIW